VAEATHFDREMGSQQGRIEPVNWTPPEGSHAYCLGMDRAGHMGRFADGDYVQIAQTASFGDRTVVGLSARYRCPAPVGATPYSWALDLLIDGVTRARRTLEPTHAGGPRVRDMEGIEACVADLAPGDHELAFRLQFAGAVDPLCVELPGVYLDAVELRP
jgi:hypothetical protein